MTVWNHTSIAIGAAGNATTFNTPLGALDAAMGQVGALNTTATNLTGAVNEVHAAIAGGATVTDALLKEWTESEAYEATSVTRNANGVATSATVKWPDGSAGTYTATTINADGYSTDAYTITHTVASKTVTQALITRDAAGNVVTKPALTIAP